MGNPDFSLIPSRVGLVLFIIGLCVTALLAPIGTWAPYDTYRVLQVILLCFAASALFFARPFELKSALSIPAKVGYPIFLAFAIGLVSATRAEFPLWALVEWSTFWLLFVFTGLISSLVSASPAHRSHDLSIAVGLFCLALTVKLSAAYIASLAPGVGLDTTILFDSTFSNRRFFGQLATLLIPVLCWLAVTARRLRFVWLFTLVLWWALLYASGTRGSWLALLMAHALATALWFRQTRRFMMFQLAAATLAAGLYWFLFYVLPTWQAVPAIVENRFDAHFAQLSGREVIWRLALDYINESPWLGIGPMMFAATPNPVAAHPHNALLQIGSEWGLPALTVLAVAIGLIFSRWAKSICARFTLLQLSLFVSLSGAAVHAMVDGVIVNPYTTLWVAILAGWAWGLQFVCAPPRFHAAESGKVFFAKAVTAFSLLSVLAGAYPSFMAEHIMVRDGQQFSQQAPRYWSDGWIKY